MSVWPCMSPCLSILVIYGICIAGSRLPRSRSLLSASEAVQPRRPYRRESNDDDLPQRFPSAYHHTWETLRAGLNSVHGKAKPEDEPV